MKLNSASIFPALLLVLAGMFSCGSGQPPVQATASPEAYADLKTALSLVRDVYGDFKSSLETAADSAAAASAIDSLTRDLVPLLKDLGRVAARYPELDSDTGKLPPEVLELQKAVEDESLVINRLMTQVSLEKFAEDAKVQDAVIRFLQALGVENPELK